MMIQKFIDGEKLFQGDQECGYLQIEDKMKKIECVPDFFA